MKAKDKAVSTVGNPFMSKWSGALPDETEEETQERLQELQEAHKRSKEIDEFLQEGKRIIDQRKRAVKILLLGQSESGKSSVLKNFQLAFAPRQFENERIVWKTIVQLNLIATIKIILDALKAEWESDSSLPRTPLGDPLPASPARNLRRIRLGLSPLFFIEANLMKLLCPETPDSRDVCVRAGSGWKALLSARRKSSPNRGDDLGRRRSQVLNNENDPTFVLAAQRDDIISLWSDARVQEVLERKRLRLENAPGFFMDDVARIATLDYVPTDSDIIRARIRTVGIEEHHFVVEKGADANSDVFITDVGGSRSQRASWVPYFDDVQAILFLAPLAFNQTLEEDPRVNRLEDSLDLWKEICQNKLLAHANLILFFNKKDVLTATLAAGVWVKKYVPSYADQPNDVIHVTKYFKNKFRSVHKHLSPIPRPFMCYETSAIDIDSMAVLLIGVRESILRQHLREGDMI
ncbi:heterotrimeric GTP-binding alpha subunit [Crucibulum laeve]|uniref:Heterotrimeric GTP-binding alpha subunit n=1 Tax=Crucibulum laeve TaxID=68775 RepID=A0A5C3MBS7_9AGAR|nr:heterotrimeric GTP-binding alpha subunit [Crucibulum laeve]